MIKNYLNIDCPLKHTLQQKDFLSNGYLKVEGAAFDCLSSLQKIANKYVKVQPNSFNYSLMQLSEEVNKALHFELQDVLLTVLNQLFTNHQFLSSSFLVKPGIFFEEMDLHQDWSFTKEQEFCPITLWIPLLDVDENNGSLFLLPKSHHVLNNFRSFDYQTSRLKKSAFEDSQVIDLEAKAGDVILFHPAIFHGSNKNITETHRLVVSATILPQKAPYIFVKKKDEHVASIQSLKDDAFFSDLRMLKERTAFVGHKSEHVPYQHKIIDAKELIYLLNLQV